MSSCWASWLSSVWRLISFCFSTADKTCRMLPCQRYCRLAGSQQSLNTSRHGFLDIEADRPAHAGAEHDVDPGGGREAAQGDAHIHVVELEGDGNGGQGTGRGLFLFFRMAHDHAGLGAQIGGCGRIALRILRELLPVIHELLLFVLLGGAGREQTEQGQEAKDGNGPLSHSILHSPQGRGEAVR